MTLISNAGPKKINFDLEILRGFAALVVVVAHLIVYNQYFNKNYFPAILSLFITPAHLAVLIFFVLSGYVIGVNHKEQLRDSNILLYLKKRFIRIYPIYFVAILLGLVVAPVAYSLRIVLANFTLTQNIYYTVIWENSPAWSLNYEVLFYLLFIPLSFFCFRPLIAMGIFLVIGAANLYFTISPIITAYCIGFCFWLSGLFIAWNFKESERYSLKLIPLFLYSLGIENILKEQHYVERLLSFIKSYSTPNYRFWAQAIISIGDLLLLPFCFMIVSAFSGKTFKYQKQIFILIQILPVYIIYQKLSHHIIVDKIFYTGIAYLALAGLFYFIKLNETLLRKIGLFLGSISYGLYIIHWPVIILFGRINTFSGNLITYTVSIVIYFGVVITLAWILEKKFQIKIKNWLLPKTQKAQLKDERFLAK